MNERRHMKMGGSVLVGCGGFFKQVIVLQRR